MRITCPVCAALYELPPDYAARLPARTRCARCGAEWLAEPEAAAGPVPETARTTETAGAPEGETPVEPFPPEEPPPEPAAVPVAARRAFAESSLSAPESPLAASAARPARSRVSDRALWFGSVAVVVLLIALFLALHRPIGHAWPASQRLFHALGLS